MSSSGAVTLGDVADKITMLEVACSRCERHVAGYAKGDWLERLEQIAGIVCNSSFTPNPYNIRPQSSRPKATCQPSGSR